MLQVCQLLKKTDHTKLGFRRAQYSSPEESSSVYCVNASGLSTPGEKDLTKLGFRRAQYSSPEGSSSAYCMNASGLSTPEGNRSYKC